MRMTEKIIYLFETEEDARSYARMRRFRKYQIVFSEELSQYVLYR